MSYQAHSLLWLLTTENVTVWVAEEHERQNTEPTSYLTGEVSET